MLELEGGVLLVGPGRLVVERGEFEVLGYVLGEGGELVVPAGRRVPGLARGRVVVEHSLAGVEPLPVEWYERVSRVAREVAGAGRAVIVGPTDSGKSTLAAWAANLSGSPLLTVDVGQNEVFCPGFASLSRDPPHVPGWARGGVESCFVGSFTPRGVESRYLGCASRLSRGGGGLVVDTDGWIMGWEALYSKAALASVVGADLVVAVGLEERWARFIAESSGTRLLLVDRLVSGGKAWEERRLHRERLVARALQGAVERTYRAGDTVIAGAPVFQGDPLDPRPLSEVLGASVVYAERVGGEIVVVARGRPRARQGARLLRPGWERGLIAAVHAEGTVYPGLVVRVNYRGRSMSILTRAPSGARLVEVGVSRVDLDGFLGQAKW